MKKIGVLIFALMMLLTLTGCDSMNYSEAQKLYETGDYEAAAAMFAELGEYEDSADMVVACDYGQAMAKYEAADYAGAALMFEALGDYEDSAEMINDCNYRIAVFAFEADDYNGAAEKLEALASAGYKDSGDMLKKAKWQIFAEYVKEHGVSTSFGTCLKETYTAGSVTYTVYIGVDGTDLYVVYENIVYEGCVGVVEQLIFLVPQYMTTGNFVYNYQMAVSSYTYKELATGVIDTTKVPCALTAGTYSQEVCDINGDVSVSSDINDSIGWSSHIDWQETMLTKASQILKDTGIGVSMKDLGFTNII